MSQIIVIGEALVEIMRPDRGTPLDQVGVFEGPYASGAPAILAVAAARLGLDVGFIGSVGSDGFGRLVAKRLAREGVNIAHLHEIPHYTTGIAFIAYTADGGREFVFHLRQSAAAVLTAEQLDADYFKNAKWLHMSGSALFLSEMSRNACARALSLTKKSGGKLSLDPNLRPELMRVDEAREVLAPYIEAADLLLPTAEEARVLTGLNDEDEAAKALLAGQERIVVLKRGAEGATVFSDEDGRVDVAGFPVTEVDPTGAGDCFNAGFIYGLEMGRPAEEAGRFACAAGALAVTKKGPMEGAPNRKEVEEFIEV